MLQKNINNYGLSAIQVSQLHKYKKFFAFNIQQQAFLIECKSFYFYTEKNLTKYKI